MPTANSPEFSKDAEGILDYLLNHSNDSMDRHKHKIRDACRLADMARTNRALKELLDSGHISDQGDGIVDLSQKGLQAANALKKKKQATHDLANMNGIMDGSATPVSYNLMINAPSLGGKIAVDVPKPGEIESIIERTLNRPSPSVPTLDNHPLRNGKPELPAPRGARPVRPRGVSVRYLLAFDSPKDGLPIPILHGDVIGRSKKCTVLIKHDEYVSQRHCRLEIARDKTTNRPALFVEDLASRNGTFVDEIEVYDGKVQLHHGSRLRIGNTIFITVEIPY